MMYVWAILLVVSNCIWLGLNLFALTGNWLMVLATVVLGWVYWDEGLFSVATLVVVVVLAAAGEVIEFLAGLLGSRTAGGSRRGAWGALLGGVLGAVLGTLLIPVPLAGSLLGACAGAAAGAWGMELSAGRRQPAAVRSALGAGVGRLLGTVAKLTLGVLIWLIVAVAAFWP